MKKFWREILIELTPEEEPIWEKAVANFWRQTAASAEYYDCPISSPEKGKARLPCDPDIILDMISQLQELQTADEKVPREIIRKLVFSYSEEEIFGKT